MEALIEFVKLTKQQSQEIMNIIMEARASPHISFRLQSVDQFKLQTKQLISTSFALEQKYSKLNNNSISFNFGIKVGERLIGVMLSLQVVDYYESIKPLIATHPYQSQFQYCNIDCMSPGTAVYFTRLSILPDMTGKKIGKRLVYESCKYLLQKGFKYSLMGSMVPISYHMFMKLGGEVVRRQQIVTTFTYQISVIKNQFEKVIEVYQIEEK